MTERPSFRKLTDRQAVLRAIEECDLLGSPTFLRKYGFGPAQKYFLLHDGKPYDSKAIVGVAYGYQFGTPLKSDDFGGGKSTVAPKLKELGFRVVADSIEERLVALPEEANVAQLWEGAKETITIDRYERNAAARTECIEHHGSICCVCGFDFTVAYGEDFLGFIHVHHLVPLSQRQTEHRVNGKEDLRPVCPNCHAIIHYGGTTRTIEEVKALLAKSKSNYSPFGK